MAYPTILYELWHLKLGPDAPFDLRDERYRPKFIGVYSSRAAAEAEILRMTPQLGFCDWPGGFRILPRPVNVTDLEDGFIDPFGDPNWPKTPSNLPCSAVLQFIGQRCDPYAVYPLVPAMNASAWGRGHSTMRLNKYAEDTEKTGGVEYNSDNLTRSPDINDHIAALLALAAPRLADLRAVIDRDDLTCRIVCFFSANSDEAAQRIIPVNAALSAQLAIPICTRDA